MGGLSIARSPTGGFTSKKGVVGHQVFPGKRGNSIKAGLDYCEPPGARRHSAWQLPNQENPGENIWQLIRVGCECGSAELWPLTDADRAALQQWKSNIIESPREGTERPIKRPWFLRPSTSVGVNRRRDGRAIGEEHHPKR